MVVMMAAICLLDVVMAAMAATAPVTTPAPPASAWLLVSVAIWLASLALSAFCFTVAVISSRDAAVSIQRTGLLLGPAAELLRAGGELLGGTRRLLGGLLDLGQGRLHLVHHGVHRLPHPADLVIRFDLHAGCEVPGGCLGGDRHEFREPPGDVPRHPEAQGGRQGHDQHDEPQKDLAGPHSLRRGLHFALGDALVLECHELPEDPKDLPAERRGLGGPQLLGLLLLSGVDEREDLLADGEIGGVGLPPALQEGLFLGAVRNALDCLHALLDGLEPFTLTSPSAWPASRRPGASVR